MSREAVRRERIEILSGAIMQVHSMLYANRQ